MLGALTSLFTIFQALSSLAVAQLLTNNGPNHLLAISLWLIAILALIVVILEASTGGTTKTPGKEKGKERA